MANHNDKKIIIYWAFVMIKYFAEHISDSIPFDPQQYTQEENIIIIFIL